MTSPARLAAFVIGLVGTIVGAALVSAMLVLSEAGPGEPAMTARDVMRITGFSENFVYQALLDGRIPGRIQCGRRVLVSRRLFEAWLNKETAEEGAADEA
jgi:hypothetical protein